MPSTEDWRSALSRAEPSPRKPSTVSSRIEHLRETARHQADAAQRRAESVNGALAYSMLTRASSPAHSSPRSPAMSMADTPTGAAAALVHSLAALNPTRKPTSAAGDASPPHPKLYVRTSATPRQDASSLFETPHLASAVSTTSAAAAPASLSASTADLNEIKQSVERLRAQRTHVEQLGQQTDMLKAQLAQQEAHNERLRAELARVQGLSQENVALLQTVKRLEERTRTLEGLCLDKRAELRRAAEQLAGADQERQQLLLTIESIEQEHAEAVRSHAAEQSRLRERVAQLERRLAAAQREHEAALERQRGDKRRLRAEAAELEQQVQALLATTARQTAVINECDRALSEAKRERASTEQSRADQRRALDELRAAVQQLEARAAATQRAWDADKLERDKHVLLLESQLAERRDKLEALRDALQERDRQLQELQSEVAELRVALRDAADDKALLGERARELQQRLETEQRDRQRWATARLQLLAEFCDEENKLTSALQQQDGARRRASSAGRAEWTREADRSDDSGGDGRQERRRGPIVFG